MEISVSTSKLDKDNVVVTLVYSLFELQEDARDIKRELTDAELQEVIDRVAEGVKCDLDEIVHEEMQEALNMLEDEVADDDDYDNDEDEDDEETYVQQMHVVSFVGGNKKDKDEDYCLYKGKEKNPYMMTHLIKEDGRTMRMVKDGIESKEYRAIYSEFLFFGANNQHFLYFGLI